MYVSLVLSNRTHRLPTLLATKRNDLTDMSGNANEVCFTQIIEL